MDISNIYESVLRECYVNDLYTITCSGVLGHRTRQPDAGACLYQSALPA
jgi:hypothetical protein